MNRIETRFAELKSANKKALVPFITTGDPAGVDITELMHALVSGGADIIELGVPFSDPAADGETIQHASERAIENGVSYEDTFAAVQAFRKKNQTTPVVLMGYLNPAEIHQSGFTGYVESAKSAGADGLILVDLSYESGAEYRKSIKSQDIDLINLIAPTTSKTRLGKILKSATGFVYYVSMRGITGANKALDNQEIEAAITAIREKSTLPICVGFGISDGDTAKKLAQYADGIVVGSALVKKLYNAQQNNENVLATATAFMQTLRHAIDD
ncbi:tryptophan synthase subunit alpha [Ostreibacterium oceani]|uniref:Tryptophan synthase alpha chain n=1 Tax=Ostreibacterium oceani TaxID=2654998 RepID=A0A6N7EW58_9GAMM|nr:tryptophan synthase subunit alpha [Ostreibacterium oceani]MPV85790.1 tryptophan synthase subunit alpha [Ostreibacterium oceani]